MWDSFRLSSEVKELLLTAFASDRPSALVDESKIAAGSTRKRFFMRARACCAFKESIREPVTPIDLDCAAGNEHRSEIGANKSGPAFAIFSIKELDYRGKVKVTLISSERPIDGWDEIARGVASGRLYRHSDQLAYAALAVRDGNVIVPKQRNVLVSNERETVAYRFWKHLVLKQLAEDKSIRLRDFHLHLGEATYRFNTRHRSKFRRALVQRLMQRFDIGSIQPLLGPKA